MFIHTPETLLAFAENTSRTIYQVRRKKKRFSCAR